MNVSNWSCKTLLGLKEIYHTWFVLRKGRYPGLDAIIIAHHFVCIITLPWVAEGRTSPNVPTCHWNWELLGLGAVISPSGVLFYIFYSRLRESSSFHLSLHLERWAINPLFILHCQTNPKKSKDHTTGSFEERNWENEFSLSIRGKVLWEQSVALPAPVMACVARNTNKAFGMSWFPRSWWISLKNTIYCCNWSSCFKHRYNRGKKSSSIITG